MLVGSAVLAYAVQRGRKGLGRPLSTGQAMAMNLLLVTLAAAAVVIVLLTWSE